MARILVVDDDLMFSDILSLSIRKMGHTVNCAATLTEGHTLNRSSDFDLIYLDVNLPDGSGLGVIEKLKNAPSQPEVIIITGDANSDGAELAIKSGAWDYVSKPISQSSLALSLERSLEYRRAKKAGQPVQNFNREGIIGSSREISFCLEQTARAAASDANTLITGETGTGKELFAWALHTNSARAGKNFVVVDCAALSATLVESTLFGYEKGAYTGADKSQEGLVKQADGGTLFLDEIGELPPAMQKSFLRVLQERRFRPVGGKTEIDSDFRLVATTHRNLDAMVAEGSFRSDLLFRLRAFHIEIPPLRRRDGDITALAGFYVAKLCTRRGMVMKSLSPDFIDYLNRYDWPGNVRELFGNIERAMVVSGESPVLFGKHLPVELRAKVTASAFANGAEDRLCAENNGDGKGMDKFQDVRQLAIARAEHDYLQKLSQACGSDVKKACSVSGLSRSRFYELMKKYNIKF
jgi:two-component system NtrC family response regulator